MTTRYLDRAAEGAVAPPAAFEDFSDASGVTDGSVSRIAHEMEALQAFLQVVEHDGNRDHARLLGRTYLGRLEPGTIEEHVIEASLLRVLGRQGRRGWECVPRPKTDWEGHVSDIVALGWLAWTSHDNVRARTIVKGLRASQKQQESFAGEGGAIHLLTLYFWSQAVTLLTKEDRTGARRYFKRAIELGSQFGTDSHPMISWAYAASFFEP